MAQLSTDRGTVSDQLSVTIDPDFNHHEIGFTMYSDGGFTTIVTSGMSGTVALSMTPAVNEYSQTISGASALDLSVDDDFKSAVVVDQGVSEIIAAASGVSGASYWKLSVRSYD